MTLNEQKIFPVQRMEDIIQQPTRFRLIERIPLTEQTTWPLTLHPVQGDEQVLVFLDVETTGLDKDKDEIIELGLVKVLYSPSLHTITQIVAVHSLYEQPSVPITPEITALTGITNEMVSGQRMDDFWVNQFLQDASAVVAHNAAFDRAFVDRRFTHLQPNIWLCSLNDVQWQHYGLEGRKLRHLLLESGYFYEAHRASVDCLATAWLFCLYPAALQELLQHRLQSKGVIEVSGYTFDIKNQLKARGYRWNGDIKAWYRSIDQQELDEEYRVLNAFGCDLSIEYKEIPAVQRYKS